MSEPLQPDLSSEERIEGQAGDTEEVDAVLVPEGEAEPVPLPVVAVAQPSSSAVVPAVGRGLGTPAVQAAAVAATSFIAGAAVVGLTQRRRRRALQGARKAVLGGRRGAWREKGGAGELIQIVGSRSLLVDVHLLGGSPNDRR